MHLVQLGSTLTLMILSTQMALASPLPERYLLSGALANEPVQLELTLESSGRASAQVIGDRGTLKGRHDENGSVHLRGAGLELTGSLPQPFEEGQPVFSGKLADGTPLSLAIRASYLERAVRQGPFLEVSSEAPVFVTAPWKGVNSALERFIQTPAATFVRDGRKLIQQGELDYPYTYENRLEPTYLSPSTLSLLETQFFYTGGAHPNTTYRSLTFVSRNGNPRRLTLGDLFRKGSDYQGILLAEVTKRLEAQNASMIRDGSVNLTARDLSVFNLTARGLVFTFAPYAVASYAEGTFTVTVPYETLEPLLEPDILP